MGRLSWIIWAPKVNTGFLISKSRVRKDQRMKCDVRSRSQRERFKDCSADWRWPKKRQLAKGCRPSPGGGKTGFPHKPPEGTQAGVTCFSFSPSVSELSPPRYSLGDDVARLKVLRFLSVIDRNRYEVSNYVKDWKNIINQLNFRIFCVSHHVICK